MERADLTGGAAAIFRYPQRMERTNISGQIIGMIVLAGILAGALLVLASGVLAAAPASNADRLPVSRPPQGTKQVDQPAVQAVAAPAQADPAAYVIKQILPIDGPLHMGDHYWDERGAPDGPILITVDLAAQTLSVFRGGHEIGTAAILYGADDKPTPLGTFPITQKDADHVSNLYGSPMPFMLRLTNTGISIHGTSVADGYMTHGCIGVPTPFAEKLFAAVKLGDKVVVTRGKMLSIGSAVSG